MPRNSLLILIFAVLLLSTIGCSSFASEEEDISMAASDCNNRDIPLPAYNIQSSAPWTWLDITVGITTDEELLTELGEPSSVSSWSRNSREPQACIYRYQHLDNYPTFWLAGGRVIGIRFSTSRDQTRMNGQPATFSEARELYGRAEIVGWSPTLGAGYRVVVWLSYGVLAEVYVSGAQLVGTVTYFSPMSEEEFSDSLWSGLVLATNPTVRTDNVDTYPRDPFDW